MIFSEKTPDFQLTPELLCFPKDGHISQKEQLIIFDQHKIYVQNEV